MSKYEYTKRNLLVHREDYMYSSFFGLEFLRDYIKNRELLIKHIANSKRKNAYINNSLDEYTKLLLNKKLTYSSLKLFLLKCKLIDKNKPDNKSIKTSKYIFTDNLFKLILLSKIENKNKKIIQYIDKFLMKFEVSKKIHEKYDLSFKRVNSSNTNLQIYINFALILCLTYVKLKNLRYLNCLLKVNDLIASQKKLSTNNIDQFKLSLMLEKIFVINLINNNKINLN